MAATFFNTTTLSEALTSSTNDFTVGSTTNITAGDLLAVRDEVIKVLEVPVSGRVKVMRGVDGTEARAHASGQRFFIIQNPEDVKRDTKRRLSVVGASVTYPDYLLPGQRAKDGAGNEFIMCEFTAVGYSCQSVLISNDGNFTATTLTGAQGAKGAVGILVEGVTSDQFAWVQIYGYNAAAQINDAASTDASGAVSSYVAVAATTASTPATGLAVIDKTSFTSAVARQGHFLVHGMFVVGAATTATTSATSHFGVAVPVFLSYPYVVGYYEDEPRFDAVSS